MVELTESNLGGAYGNPRVLGIPISKTLVIWASPSHITLKIWVRVRVRVTGDIHSSRVFGMGMPKMRRCSYHFDVNLRGRLLKVKEKWK